MNTIQRARCAEGIVFSLLGVFAILAPALASRPLLSGLGLMLAISGLVALYQTRWAYSRPLSLISLSHGVLSLSIGALLLSLSGHLALLGISLAVFFICRAIIEAAAAMQRSSRWLVVSVIADTVLAVMIWQAWPEMTYRLLAILLGAHWLSAGLSRIAASAGEHWLRYHWQQWYALP